VPLGVLGRLGYRVLRIDAELLNWCGAILRKPSLALFPRFMSQTEVFRSNWSVAVDGLCPQVKACL